jgi:hypothetical protein
LANSNESLLEKDNVMRALCGSIITAGALVGLGLTALAFGIRFETFGPTLTHGSGQELYGIPTLVVILVVLLLSVIIGLGIAFLGLAFHHERRHYELHRDLGKTERTESGGLI